MKMKIQAGKAGLAFCVLLSIIVLNHGTFASHSWGNYHWARTSNPFTLKVVDSNTSDWDDNLNRAISDWGSSSVLNLTREQGDEARNARKRCAMIAGKIRSCNADYGFNGWLGLASINLSGGHISQGSAKMNDSYLKSSSYSETNRSHVMCQEIGHDFGLDHTSEDGSDQNTCMDYSNDLGNPSPNTHDYQQLESIYAHLDSTTTVGFSFENSGVDVSDNPNSWGQLMSQSANGRSSTYERDNWNGSKTLTHVFWTQERAAICPGCDHRYDH